MKTPTTAEIIAKLSDPVQKHELINSWPTNRCSLCGNRAATGIWWTQFSKASPPFIRSELKLLCPACGFTDCYTKWNGFMCPKLIRCDLFLTLSAPEGDRSTIADRLLEKIASHPTGEKWILAWKLMWKPANIHHPIAPALDTLVEIKNRLFPTPDNKVD